MSDKVFVDTNVLIYAYSATDSVKQKQAQRLIEKDNISISTQVLQELTNVLYKKFSVSWANISSAIQEIEGALNLHTNTISTIQLACSIAGQYRFSFYDSLIIAAALEQNCTILYTEDMQHLQQIDGRLTIQNPFL